jgi:hypothetical protein
VTSPRRFSLSTRRDLYRILLLSLALVMVIWMSRHCGDVAGGFFRQLEEPSGDGGTRRG